MYLLTWISFWNSRFELVFKNYIYDLKFKFFSKFDSNCLYLTPAIIEGVSYAMSAHQCWLEMELRRKRDLHFYVGDRVVRGMSTVNGVQTVIAMTCKCSISVRLSWCEAEFAFMTTSDKIFRKLLYWQPTHNIRHYSLVHRIK